MTKETLEEFLIQRYSTYKIAKILNLSQTNIRYWLKKYNLTTNYPKSLNKKCPKCSKVKSTSEFYGDKSQIRRISVYCKSCLKDHTIERQRKFKEDCVKYKGSKCVICSYNKYIGALEFHHLDPSKKDFSISNQKLTKFDSRIFEELNKCVLLCANCHREVHSGLVELPRLELGTRD